MGLTLLGRFDWPRSWEGLRMYLITESNRKWWVVIAMALTTLLMTIDFMDLRSLYLP